MAGIITNITSIVTGAAGWASSWLNMITADGNEVLFLFVLIPVVGLGIGLVKRLLRV